MKPYKKDSWLEEETWQMYWARGWFWGFVLGFVLDVFFIWQKSCLSRVFGLGNAWWTECKSLGAGSVVRVSPVNLGDFWIIFTFSFLTGCLGWLYWKIFVKE